MPLKEGSSKKVIGDNIADLIRSGVPKKNAIRAAHDKARGGSPKKKKKSKSNSEHKDEKKKD